MLETQEKFSGNDHRWIDKLVWQQMEDYQNSMEDVPSRSTHSSLTTYPYLDVLDVESTLSLDHFHHTDEEYYYDEDLDEDDPDAPRYADPYHFEDAPY